MRYKVTVCRIDKDGDAVTDPIYEDDFDANVDMADEIGELAGNAIAEAIQCDVAAQVGSHD